MTTTQPPAPEAKMPEEPDSLPFYEESGNVNEQWEQYASDLRTYAKRQSELLAAALRERDEDEQLRNRMDDLLTRTANALKGDPGPLRLHDWSRLPDIAAELKLASELADVMLAKERERATEAERQVAVLARAVNDIASDCPLPVGGDGSTKSCIDSGQCQCVHVKHAEAIAIAERMKG